jgi:hypothetical protein
MHHQSGRYSPWSSTTYSTVATRYCTSRQSEKVRKWDLPATHFQLFATSITPPVENGNAKNCKSGDVRQVFFWLADLMSLQTKFEEDKKKVAEMKAARRFKPY